MHRAYSLDWSPNALSPTAQKNVLKKNLKKVAQLEEELQSEIAEKNDLLEENTSLKKTVENLNHKLKLKTEENTQLKDDLHDLQLIVEKSSENFSPPYPSKNEVALNNLKSEIIEHKKYIVELEVENESAKKAWEKCEEKCLKITDEYVIMENHYEELKLSLAHYLETIERLEQRCNLMNIELLDLKECNQVLKEENIKLETKKSTVNENSECLERELQFQFMKDEIERMTNNLQTIENEQTKLISVNVDLAKEKAEMIRQQQLLSIENEDVKLRNEELRQKVDSLSIENESLKTSGRNLDLKLKDVEKLLCDSEKRLESLMAEYKSVEHELLNKKEELRQKCEELIENNRSLILQLEAVINEKENYQIACQEQKIKLEAKEVEYDVLASEKAKLTAECSQLSSLLQKTELDLNLTRQSKEKIEGELALKINLIESLQADHSTLTKRLQKLTFENENMCQSLTNANEQLTSLKQNADDLLIKLDETKAENEKIVQENDLLTQANKKFTEQLQLSTSRNCELKTELENKISEFENISAEHVSLKSTYYQLKENDSKVMNALRYENEQIKSSNAELLESNHKQSSVIQSLQSQIQDLLCAKDSLSKELQDSETKYINLMKDFHEKLDAASHKQEALATRNDVLRKEITNLQSRFCAISREKESYQEQIKVLEDQIGELLISKNCLSDESSKATLSHAETSNKLEEKLKAMLRELESQSAKNHLVEKDNIVLHEKLAAMSEQEKILLQNLENHAEQISQLQQELNKVVNERDHFSASSSRLTEENLEFQNRVVDFSTNNEELRQQIEESEKMKLTLSNKNEELLKTIRELETNIAEFTASKSALTQKLEENRMTFAEKLGELQQNLKRTHQEYEEQLQCNERLTNENVTLVSRTTEILKENNSLRQQLKNLNENLSILSKTNSEHVLKIQSLQDEIGSVEQNRSELLEKLRECEENFRGSINSLQEKLNTALQDCQLQAEKAVQLAEENSILQARISDLMANTECLQQELEDLKKEKADAADRSDAQERTIQELEKKLEDALISNDSLSQTILSNETCYAQKIDLLSRQLDTLLLEKESCLKNNLILVEKNTKLQNQIAELLKVEQQLRVEVEKFKEEKFALLEKDTKQLSIIQDLEKQIENLSSANNSLTEELQTKELNYVQRHQELENELISVSLERERLVKNNSQLVTENVELKNRVFLIQKENLETQNQLKELHEEKTSSLNDLREMLLLQIDQLQKANEEIRDENHKLLEKNAEKLLCLKEVEKRFELLTQDMKELKLKTEELEMINEELQRKVEECKENETKLRNENASLKEVIDRSESGKENLIQQIEVLSNNEKSLKNNLQDAMKEIEEAKLDNRELKKVITVESEAKENLNKQNSALLEKIDYLESEKEKSRSEIDELSNRFSLTRQERKTEFQKLQQENLKLKTRLEELTAQKEELYKMDQINKDVFENQLESFSTKNQCLQSEVEKLHDLIETMDADMITLKGKIQKSESIIDELRSSSEKEKIKIVSAFEDEKERNAEISVRLESFRKESETISEQLKAEKQRANDLVQIYETQLQKEIEMKKSLECRIQNMENCEMESLRKRIAELKSKLDEVLEANESLVENSKLTTNQHELLLKENENLMQKIDQLKKQMAKVEQECDQLLEEKEMNRKLHDEMRLQVKNLSELLEGKDSDIVRLKDEYAVFKEEYRKLVQHKGELDKEFQETILLENSKLSKKCDELSDANLKFVEQLAEKTKLIESLRVAIDRFEHRDSSPDEKSDLNETRVVASGPENEIYMNLRQENIKLAEERDNYKKLLADTTQQLEKEKEAYRSKAQNLFNKISTKMIAEYEGKLERAKAEYQKILKQKYSMQENDWKKREEEYKLMLKKEKEHIRDLSSQMWDISDKYLQLKQRFETKTSPLKFRTYSEETLFSPSTLSRRTKSATQLNLMGGKGYRVSDFDRRLSTMSEDLPPQMRRRQTLTTSGKKFSLSSAKVFPTEDEEQEIFDNACLADLKRGRVSVDDSNDFSKQRLSILQQRNSLCPPHLKSSYPAETQFIPPQEFRENDIKLGLVAENDNSDIENLIPRESLRKNRNQTSYKKPGPPTPGKNGGRTNQSEHQETPRNVLKELNDNGSSRRKSFTPKFLNHLFALRGHATVTIPQDENVSTTPRQNRLSSIRRRFSRNPQEFGNTNSGFC